MRDNSSKQRHTLSLLLLLGASSMMILAQESSSSSESASSATSSSKSSASASCNCGVPPGIFSGSQPESITYSKEEKGDCDCMYDENANGIYSDVQKIVIRAGSEKMEAESTGHYTLRAECHFGQAGKVDVIEHFDGEDTWGPTATFDSEWWRIPPYTKGKDKGKGKEKEKECVVPNITTRYLMVNVSSLRGLCPRSSYTLTLHQFSNVANKCKNVGPLLGGAAGIVTESLAIGAYGDLAQPFSTNALQKIPLALIPTQYNPVSAIGGACVLTLNDNCFGAKKYNKKKKSKKCRPACPVKLCAPIVISTYNQVVLPKKKPEKGKP